MIIVLVVVSICSYNVIRLAFYSPAQSNLVVRDGLRISPEVANLGTVQQGKRARVTFSLTNVGGDDVRDIVLEPSCGCTLVECSKSNLMPGDSTDVIAEFDSRKRRGDVLLHLLLAWAVKDTAKRQLLSIQGNVEPTVSVTPPVVRFVSSKVRPGSKMSSVIVLRTPDWPNLKVSKLTCSHPALRATVVSAPQSTQPKAGHSQPLGGIAILVEFDPSAQNLTPSTGRDRRSVSVLTNVDTEPEIDVPVWIE
jgi:hypothetical protein